MSENNKINKLVILFVPIFVIFCVMLNIYVDKRRKDNQQEVSRKLDETSENTSYSWLTSEPVYENDTYICFEDRIVLNYKMNPEQINNVASYVNGINKQCKSIERIYVMPVPDQILVNDGYKEQQQQYADLVKGISDTLPDNAEIINPLQVLKEHTDEYIYFRTDDSWTQTGTYYAFNELAKQMDIDTLPLDNYEKYSYNHFLGNLVVNNPLLNELNTSYEDDYVEYYNLPDSVNRVEVFAKDDNGEIYSYKRFLYSEAASNLGTFVYTSDIRAIVEGESIQEKNKDKYLLVICDEAGKVIVPFLKDYYDGIYVVNIALDDNFYEDINNIVKEYNISEVLYIQKSMRIGDSGYSKALNDFRREDSSNE